MYSQRVNFYKRNMLLGQYEEEYQDYFQEVLDGEHYGLAIETDNGFSEYGASQVSFLFRCLLCGTIQHADRTPHPLSPP